MRRPTGRATCSGSVEPSGIRDARATRRGPDADLRGAGRESLHRRRGAWGGTFRPERKALKAWGKETYTPDPTFKLRVAQNNRGREFVNAASDQQVSDADRSRFAAQAADEFRGDVPGSPGRDAGYEAENAARGRCWRRELREVADGLRCWSPSPPPFSISADPSSCDRVRRYGLTNSE